MITTSNSSLYISSLNTSVTIVSMFDWAHQNAISVQTPFSQSRSQTKVSNLFLFRHLNAFKPFNLWLLLISNFSLNSWWSMLWLEMLQKVMSHCAKLEHIEPRVGRNIPLLNGFFLGTTMQSLCADGFRLKLSHF